MTSLVFDIEADGLLHNATKIHVLSWYCDGEYKYTHDYDEMREVLTNSKLLIGHNIICYDVPLINKILGIDIKARLIDTLPLSWYLNHRRVRHGLELYGEEFGIPKPEIKDWENLSKEEYAHRCNEDVKINLKLWKKLKTKLTMLYGDKKKADKLLRYLTFKMHCAKLQQDSKWKLDEEFVNKSLSTLIPEQEEVFSKLVQAMPKVGVYKTVSKPSKPFKRDGTLSVTGAKWFKLLSTEGKDRDFSGDIVVKISEKDPNPNSTPQIKDWLFSLGWVPEVFDTKIKENGEENKVPQIRIDSGGGKELCKSVLKLADEHKEVNLLQGITVLSHRINILKGFLRDSENGYIVAGVAGLTNTLRFKHRTIVNLPGVSKAYGDLIRGSLVARDGYELCGSDMSSLEETTKKHFMFKFDPDFVEEMSQPGFDAHLDLAKHAGRVSQEDIDRYSSIKSKLDKDIKVLDEDMVHYVNVSLVRKIYKVANYACVYGVGANTLSKSANLTKKAAQELIEAYWKRNWAVKAACDEVEVKTLDGDQWLLNPVSNLWYSLRNEKDIFSTLNQGTGVYCFDTWIKYILSKREQLSAQFHDEIVLEIKKGYREKCEKFLEWAINMTNQELNLNLKLGVDIQFGNSYAEIH